MSELISNVTADVDALGYGLPSLSSGRESVEEARRRGRDLRKQIPRSVHAEMVLPDRDPIGIIAAQNATRVEELVPVRIGRMLQSPFTYYRGTAAIMAHDLAADTVTGINVVACGDAHIANFGLFASPERRVLFDLNDFDEGGMAPWEWDLKRLAASVYIGARDISMTENQCHDATRFAVRTYRESLNTLMDLGAIERYYFKVDTEELESTLNKDNLNVLQKTLKKARTRTSDHLLTKITTHSADGRLRIIDEPPVSRHVEHATLEQMNDLYTQYIGTLREDVAVLLSQFTMVDYVMRVVGVGSVGTRCYVVMFEGPGGGPLFLQIKEAPPSVLQSHGKIDRLVPGTRLDDHGRYSQGHRVVAAQRILQAQSDPFLGWMTGFAGDNGERPPIDYYWRQFRDVKGSVNLAKLTPTQFNDYGGLCARLLARAHSQSPGGAAARGYLGSSERFDDAVAEWSRGYADVCEADFEALEKAVADGRMPAEFGV